MIRGRRIGGWPLFFLLLLIFALAGIGAFLATGGMGIEERFSRAAGMGEIPHGEEEAGAGQAGIRIEGDPVAYLGVLLILGGAAAVLAYRYRHR
jgi:hypothetical protein